jgi:rare lipoprotein A (peptidoglycan hydrolase)
MRSLAALLHSVAIALIAALLLSTDHAAAAPSLHPSWQRTAATWYGPGFYGNDTACGQRYTQRIRGVAVPSAGPMYLRCGTRVTLCRRGTCVRVKVIDTGSFREHQFDLSARTAMDLCRCTSPHTMDVRWRFTR